MRNIILSFAVAGAALMTGPVYYSDVPRAVEEFSTPHWIALPAGAEVQKISLLGGPGHESARGTVEADVPFDSAAGLEAMISTLRSRGYRVLDETSVQDRFFGASHIVFATHPLTGRSMRVVGEDGPDGGRLRVTFEDPRPVFARLDD